MRHAAFALLALAAACSQNGTPLSRWQEYRAAIDPALLEYRSALISIGDIDICRGTFPGKTVPSTCGGSWDEARVASEIEARVVPHMKKSLEDLSAVAVPSGDDELAKMHARLQEGIRLRAHVYEAMVTAFRAKNTAAFTELTESVKTSENLLGPMITAINTSDLDKTRPSFPASTPTATPAATVRRDAPTP